MINDIRQMYRAMPDLVTAVVVMLAVAVLLGLLAVLLV
jgi:hypothetical protein